MHLGHLSPCLESLIVVLHVAWGATEKICLPTPANGRQHSDFRLSSYLLFHYAFCCNCGRGIQELLNSGASSQAGDCSLHWQFTQFTLVHTIMWVFNFQDEPSSRSRRRITALWPWNLRRSLAATRIPQEILHKLQIF